MEEFKILVEVKKTNIIAITETWFNESSIANLEGFTLYKKDRQNGKRGGGVALFIDNNIVSYEVNQGILKDSNFEQIWAVIVINSMKYLIWCIYRPQDQVDMSELKKILSEATHLVDTNVFCDLLIMGDFNLPHIKWSNGYAVDILGPENSIEHQFTDIINDEFLIQHVSLPIFQLTEGVINNILDLIFTKSSERIYELIANTILGNLSKGHLVLTFKYSLNDQLEQLKPKYKFDYTRSNFNGIKEMIDNVDWVKCLENLSVQEMYDMFLYRLSQACNSHIPKININSDRRKKNRG
jgi:hypothetical protein